MLYLVSLVKDSFTAIMYMYALYDWEALQYKFMYINFKHVQCTSQLNSFLFICTATSSTQFCVIVNTVATNPTLLSCLILHYPQLE